LDGIDHREVSLKEAQDISEEGGDVGAVDLVPGGDGSLENEVGLREGDVLGGRSAEAGWGAGAGSRLVSEYAEPQSGRFEDVDGNSPLLEFGLENRALALIFGEVGETHVTCGRDALISVAVLFGVVFLLLCCLGKTV